MAAAGKMKKKIVFILTILILVLGGLYLYFQPVSLLDKVNADDTILITVNELGVKDGNAYIDARDYTDITLEQKQDILSLLKDYPYKRTFGTFFSDGSLESAGDRLVYIYLYNENQYAGSIFISSAGKMSVDDKTYRMENASQLIGQMVEILIGGTLSENNVKPQE